ncbi:formate dehydrogenase accessory sulfurtransferase FdhD [Mucilaginibacter sp. CSA2-8R]|uniref:formate dehydrogenase accessory sulfurtransferase FdhD n=1 Tax=Mucilaginibacter sp. CSA2-8R TaxID=3141542 RepID=UPI00315DD2F7
MSEAIKQFQIIKAISNIDHRETDNLAIEEPLEIRLVYGPLQSRIVKSISVTMRTPGNDAELATGFLFTEGIIKSAKDLTHVYHNTVACSENKQNIIQAELREDITPHLQNTERNFYTTSSCGVCGKGSISAIRTVHEFACQQETWQIDHELLYRLPQVLQDHQAVFADTGGLHASALFNLDGELLMLREDVGRHNALDKLIGSALKANLLPLSKSVLLLSGRASFELIQKAASAGITLVAAVGAPSSLAVELAQEFNMTLIGFLRNQRFNIYSAPQRISSTLHPLNLIDLVA